MNLGLQSNTGSRQFLNFSEALYHLRWGERVSRRTWGGYWLKMDYSQDPPRILYYPRDAVPVVWACGQSHIIAEDWYVLGEHE